MGNGKNFLGAVLMVLFLAGGASYAQDAAHHAPPQAAIDACSAKSEGDTCDYTNSKGEDKAGTCANTSDQQLFCKRSRKTSS